MTEDFDKEAEREKLREKYERDKEKRQATEQMSELLLQGATMTNAHCSQCGDPIFRYEGQEFCPTCEKPVDRGEADGEDSEDDGESIQVTTPSDDAHVSFGDNEQANEDATAEQRSDQQPATTEQRDDPRRISTDDGSERRNRQQAEPNQQTAAQASSHQQEPAQPSQQEQATGSEQPRQRPPSGTPDETSVTAARESLLQTLTRFSQQAAATDDPNRAQEHLAAAREAAEALAALRQ